jgi:hypothetical protein
MLAVARAARLAVELGQFRLDQGLVLFLVALGVLGAPPARSSGIDSRKTMIPPKQIQYHVFHWPTVAAAAACTAAAWAVR